MIRLHTNVCVETASDILMEGHMERQYIERERAPLLVPETAAHYQTVSRAVGEAARLRAAHRYFQRTTYRPPLRRELLPLE